MSAHPMPGQPVQREIPKASPDKVVQQIRPISIGVGMPSQLLLQQFGEHVRRAFGHFPYLVGSALREKQWRDIDVRLILPDDEYAAGGWGDPRHPQANKKWVSTVLAWTSFARQLTHLPVDFQVQQQSHANETEDGPRSALFSLCDAE